MNTTSDRVKTRKAVDRVPSGQPSAGLPGVRQGRREPRSRTSRTAGAGKSRFAEPKRHFRKPLEISPLVAIDRERCILCYRCVASREVAEDFALVFLDAAITAYVGTETAALCGPVLGQHHRALPGGGLDLHRLPLARGRGTSSRRDRCARCARASAT
ncbi:MAG: hypothetical protein WKF40_05720 [Thermoleophilaceae bacterium]